MSLGRPIITTDVPGCREVVDEGITGFLCKPKDYVSLAQKMEMMVNLPHETRVSMGKQGREKIQNEFSEDIVCELYNQAINSGIR